MPAIYMTGRQTVPCSCTAPQATPTAVGDAPTVTQAAPEPTTKARRNADVFFETETIIRHLLEPKPVKR